MVGRNEKRERSERKGMESEGQSEGGFEMGG